MLRGKELNRRRWIRIGIRAGLLALIVCGGTALSLLVNLTID